MPENVVDILENDFSPETLAQLLRDHTTARNILWATHDYELLGEGYQYGDELRPELITGKHGNIIKPRILKPREQQTDRSKDMAEVFTPAWVCNAQNNLVDEAWFGRRDVFNVEIGVGADLKSAPHESGISNPSNINGDGKLLPTKLNSQTARLGRITSVPPAWR